MNRHEQLQRTLTTVLAGLTAAGFRGPMQMVITGATGGFLALRIEEDGSVREEFSSEHTVFNFPIVVRVFDDHGKRHTVTIIDGDEKGVGNPMEEVLVQ
jgi:hypothetical protein